MDQANPARGGRHGDLRKQADDVLARARTRNCRVITLDTAGSPADCASTLVLPRQRVSAADPDATQVLGSALGPPGRR